MSSGLYQLFTVKQKWPNYRCQKHYGSGTTEEIYFDN